MDSSAHRARAGRKLAWLLAALLAGQLTRASAEPDRRNPARDQELVLRVTEQGVLLFQRREGWVDCDGRPLMLFPRLYDFASSRFRAARPRIAPATADLPLLTPTPRLPPRLRSALAAHQAPLNSFDWQLASSQLGDGGKASLLTPPLNLSDGDPATAWVEGAGGHGIGARVIARRATASQPLRGLLLIPGAIGGRSAHEHNRIKTALLQLGGKQPRRYRLRFSRDPLRQLSGGSPYFWVELPAPSATRCVSLTVESVFPGRRAQRRGRAAGETAIAELRLVTAADLAGIAPLLSALAGNDRLRRDNAKRVLMRQGPRLLGPLKRLAANANTATRSAIVDLLLRMRHPTTAELLASLLPQLAASEQTRVLAELARHGPSAVPYVVPLLQTGGSSLDQQLVAVLGHMGGTDARAALVALAGIGPRELRAATVRALAGLQTSGSCGALVKAATASTSAPARADLIAAIGRNCSRRGSGVRRKLDAKLTRWWSTARDFETRYRVVQAIGRLTPEAHLEGLLRASARSPEPPLRWAAAQAIGKAAPSTSRTALLRAALADTDPRVRRAAVEALARSTSDLAATQADLLSLLDTERWPLVAEATANALARNCSPPAIAGLRRALRHEQASVGEAATSGLARCAPEALLAEAPSLARDRTLSAARRAHALRVLPKRLAAAHASQLLRLLRDLRARARSDADLHLVTACLVATATSPSAQVTTALVGLLSNDPDRSIRASAAEALTGRCGAEASRALRAALKDPCPTVRQVARMGLTGCRRMP